jgi:ribosomal protein L37AE/L43A
MSDNWTWEQTDEICPNCRAKLFFADDPDSDTWESTGIFKCDNCGFSTSEDQWDSMDGGDWEFDDDNETE